MPSETNTRERPVFVILHSMEDLNTFQNHGNYLIKTSEKSISLPDSFYKKINEWKPGHGSGIFATRVGEGFLGVQILFSIARELINSGFRVVIPICQDNVDEKLETVDRDKIPEGTVMVINASRSDFSGCNPGVMKRLFNDFWIEESRGKVIGYPVVGIVDSDWRSGTQDRGVVTEAKNGITWKENRYRVAFGLVAALLFGQMIIYILDVYQSLKVGLYSYLTVMDEPFSLLRSVWVSYLITFFVIIIIVSLFLLYVTVNEPFKHRSRMFLGSGIFLLSMVLWPLYVIISGLVVTPFFGSGYPIPLNTAESSVGSFVVTILQFYILAISILVLTYYFLPRRAYTAMSLALATMASFAALTDITYMFKFAYPGNLLLMNTIFTSICVIANSAVSAFLVYIVLYPLTGSERNEGLEHRGAVDS